MIAEKTSGIEQSSFPPLSGLESDAAVPLRIPLTLVLNTMGLSLINKGEARREKGRAGYEVPVQEYNPELIQKLMVQNCLQRIDITLNDVVGNRHEIIDISKLVLFSVFYKQFRRDVFEMTIRSPLIIQWNRQHPRQTIDTRSDHSLYKLENTLAKRKEEVYLYQRNMLNRLWTDHGYLFKDADHQKKMGMAGKLLKNMHPLTQIILLDYWKHQDIKLLSQNILLRVADFLKRYNLPEFNALVLLEYLQCSEREYLVTQYRRILENNGRSSSEYPMNDLIREELVKRKITPATRFSFLFETRNSQSRGQVNRLRTMVVSGGKELREINDLLFHRQSGEQDRKSIKSYLELEGVCDENYNPEILHFYMNHLEEECRTTGCSFSSFVNSGSNNGLSITHLVFES